MHAMSQKNTQSTAVSEDTLSDDMEWGKAPAFAESPIPEEASFLSSEGFQGDRIQGEPLYRPGFYVVDDEIIFLNSILNTQWR